MLYSELLGFETILGGLWRSARDGRLAHALLFRGRSGIGKFQALQVLARGLLCARGPASPCEVCGPCKRALAGSHPDLFVLDPSEYGLEQIPIAAIVPRAQESENWKLPSVGEFLSLRSHEGGWKIVLLRSAERMNASAQNAFLKTLEEPTSATLLALETHTPEALLSTVRSRLIEVRCQELASEAVGQNLLARGYPAERAALLADMACGSLGQALALERFGAPAMLEQLQRLERGELRPAETLAALCELPGEFEGRTPLAELRARVRVILDLILERLRRRYASLEGCPPAQLALLSCLQARADVDLNLAPEATLMRALLALAPSRVGYPKTTLTAGNSA